MNITCLVENTCGENCSNVEHGLSLYIETLDRKILFDAGQSDKLLYNANNLDINLLDVEYMILSHGHYDHSGGIIPFSRINNKAKIIIHEKAFGEYYHRSVSEERYIGIDKNIRELSNINIISGDYRIDNALSIFSGVNEKILWPKGNSVLKEKIFVDEDYKFIQDEFNHEQYLVIEQEGKKILISGCAHNGILNIVNEFYLRFGEPPYAVISGFHMMNKNGYSDEEVRIIENTAVKLNEINTIFYTCHCTGEEPYRIMKEIMKDKLFYLHCGDRISV